MTHIILGESENRYQQSSAPTGSAAPKTGKQKSKFTNKAVAFRSPRVFVVDNFDFLYRSKMLEMGSEGLFVCEGHQTTDEELAVDDSGRIGRIRRHFQVLSAG
jgi:hypothetical protein